MSTSEVVDKIKELNVVPVVADWSDKNNWVIAEFIQAMGRSSIPYYPVVPASPNKKLIETIPEVLLPGSGNAKVIAALEEAAAL